MDTEPVSPSTPLPERLKQENGGTPPSEGRNSPPPNCAICLGSCRNKSFTDSCLHQFCFNCLVTWSKIKAECPLCKQTFKSIIHNVRSNLQYEEYLVEQRAEVEALPVDDLPDTNRRFRYSEGSAIQRLLIRHVEGAPPPRPDAFAHRRPFRQVVYRHNLWARLLPDFTGRLRDATPEFYRVNEAQKYRLVPWLNRELDFLLCANHGHIAYVMARILDLLPVCSITSAEFHSAMLPFFGERTEHFLHELLCFASTPYDMLGYDRNVQYGPDPRIGANTNHVISSSESDSDSDIVMVAPPPPLEPPPQYVVPIETISHSDTEDSSSEVIVTGYIKPPQDRTPEVVDLIASDSDVLVQENSPPPSTSRQAPSASALVKLTLSRRLHPPDSDSDEEYIPRKRSKKRHRTQDSASTTSTRRETPAPSDASWNANEAGTSTTLSLHSWESDNERSYTPPLEDLPITRSKGKKVETRDEKKKKLKKKRARSRCTLGGKLIDSVRKKDKESKKSKRSKDKSRQSKTSEREKPGTSGMGDYGREKRLRSVICTLPISSFTGRSTEVTSSETSRSAETVRSGSSSRAAEAASSGNSSLSVQLSNLSGGSRVGSTHHSEGSSGASGTKHTGRRRALSSSDSEDNLPLNLTIKK